MSPFCAALILTYVTVPLFVGSPKFSHTLDWKGEWVFRLKDIQEQNYAFVAVVWAVMVQLARRGIRIKV